MARLQSTATHQGYRKPRTDALGERVEGEPPRAILQKRGPLPWSAALRGALASSLTNIYMYANLVYLAYAIGALYIDYWKWDFNGTTNYPDQEHIPGSSNGKVSPTPYGYIDAMYIGWNFVHLTNAIMYVANWIQMGYPLFSLIQIPEFLNIIGAALYISSSFYYDDANSPAVYGSCLSNPEVLRNISGVMTNVTYLDVADCATSAGSKVRALEMAASTIDLLAAAGWCVTWWMSYERLPGRGWTLDDPDTWSNSTTLVAALLYFTYNVRVQLFPDEYWTEGSFAYSLYQYGDVLYFVGSVFYVLDAFRDDGWFFFMPSAGRPGWEFAVVEAAPGETTTPKAAIREVEQGAPAAIREVDPATDA